MSRPRLEVADIIRSAGADFIERNRSWLRWTHLKVLLAIARCRTAALGGHIDEVHRLRTSCHHLLQLVSQPALPKVSDRCPGTLDRGTPPRTAAHALRPCRLHAAAATGFVSTPEQEGHLRFAAPGQRRNPAGGRAQSRSSRSRDRLLRRAPYLEPETPTEPSLMMPGIIISFFFSE